MVNTRARTTVTTKDGINWYYEQEGTGPDVVLIPDGLGECQMFDKAMSIIASNGFKVTTFDMPGMSRSSSAPPETYQNVTGQKLAEYGCSSGASTVMALCSNFPERVRNGMPHELPTVNPDSVTQIHQSEPATISQTMAGVSRALSGDEEAWDALGPEVHARLHDNYPRWAYG